MITKWLHQSHQVLLPKPLYLSHNTEAIILKPIYMPIATPKLTVYIYLNAPQGLIRHQVI